MLHTPRQSESSLAYVRHLLSLHRDELGFLSTLALHEYWQRGQILLQHENGQPCGYVLWYDGRNGNRPLRRPADLAIHHACIQYDARRITHGTELVRWIVQHARASGFSRINAWVADDIPANAFWKAIGFQHVATRLGGEKRKRVHNLWARSTAKETVPAVLPITGNPTPTFVPHARNRRYRLSAALPEAPVSLGCTPLGVGVSAGGSPGFLPGPP